MLVSLAGEHFRRRDGSSTMTSTSQGAPTAAAPRPVAAHVELLISFTNSEDHELHTDDLTTRADLTRWLLDHGLLERRVAATEDELSLAHRLRDGLHAALVANHDGFSDNTALEAAAAQLPLQLSGATDQPGLRPLHDGIRGALSRVLIAVNSSVADDTWRRLKICSADDCRWSYFDTTKNRSRAWCEWGCGNKVKTRNYRARKKAADQLAGDRLDG
jgi:predicted RNA-binding Zn ribbon-like protein